MLNISPVSHGQIVAQPTPSPRVSAPVLAAPAAGFGRDVYAAPSIPDPPGPTTGTPQRFWDRITPKELIGSIALHVGGGALIAGAAGAGIAALTGATLGTGLLIGAGIGAVLGGAFLAAVLAFAG